MVPLKSPLSQEKVGRPGKCWRCSTGMQTRVLSDLAQWSTAEVDQKGNGRLALDPEGWEPPGWEWGGEASTVVIKEKGVRAHTVRSRPQAAPGRVSTAPTAEKAAWKGDTPGRKMHPRDEVFQGETLEEKSNVDFKFSPPWPVQIKSRTSLHKHPYSSIPVTPGSLVGCPSQVSSLSSQAQNKGLCKDICLAHSVEPEEAFTPLTLAFPPLRWD